VKLTGIQERRYALEDETATHLAAIAVQHALAGARHVGEIDGIIMATLLPDQPVPSRRAAWPAPWHQDRPGFRSQCRLRGLAVCPGGGPALMRAGTAHRLLVVTAELLSRITNPNDQSTAFLFGDGAGAAVLVDAAGGTAQPMNLSGDASFFDAIQRSGGACDWCRAERRRFARFLSPDERAVCSRTP